MFPRRFLAIPVKQKLYPVCKAEFLRQCLSSAYHILSKGMNKADKTLVLGNLCCAKLLTPTKKKIKIKETNTFSTWRANAVGGQITPNICR